MHGAAISFAESVKERNQQIDFYILSDLTDLGIFRSLLPNNLLAPMILYMHENQLTYPWNKTDRDVANQRNHHYSFINYTSMLAADSIWFAGINKIARTKSYTPYFPLPRLNVTIASPKR